MQFTAKSLRYAVFAQKYSRQKEREKSRFFGVPEMALTGLSTGWVQVDPFNKWVNFVWALKIA